MFDEDLYPQYCKHNNPIHYPFCVGCRIEKEKKQEKIYQDYINEKYGNIRFDPFTCEIEKDVTKEEFKPLRKSKSFEELKKSYHKLCREYHPDKGGDEETFKNLNNLYHDLELRFR